MRVQQTWPAHFAVPRFDLEEDAEPVDVTECARCGQPIYRHEAALGPWWGHEKPEWRR